MLHFLKCFNYHDITLFIFIMILMKYLHLTNLFSIFNCMEIFYQGVRNVGSLNKH